jgi:hypothetical protein
MVNASAVDTARERLRPPMPPRVALAVVTVATATSAIVAWGDYPELVGDLRPWFLAALAGVAFWLVSGTLGLAGQAMRATGRVEAVLVGARAAWPSALVLVALPVASRQPGWEGSWLPPLVTLGAALVLAYRVHRGSPTRIPLVASRGGGRLGAWEIALLGVSLTILAWYVRLGALAEGNFQNDAAYSFGVARHMALSHRIEEPIVWHMLDLPETLVHAPFDYWGGLTPLVLAPVLAVFGATQHVAFLAMAAISGLSVVGFWYLVCVALPLRYRALQALGLLAFAFSSSADSYRFDTESLPLHHGLLIAALVGLAEGRLLLAVGAGFLLLVNRADGAVLFAGITLAAAFCGRTHEGGVRRVIMAAGGLFALYVTRSLIAFHALLPPGASTAVRLHDELELFALHAPRKTLSSLFVERFSSEYLLERLARFADLLGAKPLVPGQALWFTLAALPGVAWLRRRRGVAPLVPIAALGSGFVIVWASGPLAHNWRTLGTLLPLLVLACAVGASAWLDLLVAGTRRARRLGVAWPLLATTAAFAVAYPIAARIQPYSGRPPAAMVERELQLQELDELLQGAPVAAIGSWYVMAQTRSPVVSIPEDGEAAIAEVLHKYRIPWIVIAAPGYTVLRGSGAVITELVNGSRSRIGDLPVERVRLGGSLLVFRVVWPG